jgi:hypothetical protein
MTRVNEVYLPGVSGDVFDIISAYPDTQRWRTIDGYPVVIAAGDIELTETEGKRLAKHVTDGGTLLVAEAHLTGPGLQELKLPATENLVEADRYRWLSDPAEYPSPRFQCRPIKAAKGDRILASRPRVSLFASPATAAKAASFISRSPAG